MLQNKKSIINNHKVIALENIESWTGRYIQTDSKYQGENFKFLEGDILFGKLRPYLAKVFRCKYSGIAFGDLLVYRPSTNIHSTFSFYYMSSKLFINIVDSSTYGTKMPRASSEFINDMAMLVPSIKEQINISNYLDKKTAEIDTLIAQKEQLLELYEEEKKGIINQAVTKGVNPNVNMQDSGIPWLGEIPEHWEIKKLKYIGKSIIGLTYSPDEVVFDRAKLVLRSSNIQDGKLSLKDCVYVDKEIPEKLVVRKGDILICSRNGSRALIGKNITINKELEGNTFGAFMTVFRTEYYEFVSKYFNSQVFNGQSGLFLTSTVNQLTIHTLNNFFIALPPKDERKVIVDFINDKTKIIDEKIQRTKNIIALQKEYRTALISEVVTGKIKVSEER